MPDYTIQPLVGIGPIRLGMSREEVRRVMSEPPNVFRKSPASQYETDAFHQNEFQVFYGGAQPEVEFIELSSGSIVRALYLDLDVFQTPAEEVVDRISQESEFDPGDPEIPYSYLFRALR